MHRWRGISSESDRYWSILSTLTWWRGAPLRFSLPPPSAEVTCKAHLYQSPIGSSCYIFTREKKYISKKEGSTSDYVCVYNRILHHRECRESPQRTTCYYYSRRSRTASNKPRRLRWVSRPGVCACVGLSLLLYHPPNIYLLLRIYPLSLLRPAQGSVCHGLPLRRQVSPN